MLVDRVPPTAPVVNLTANLTKLNDPIFAFLFSYFFELNPS